MDLNNNSKSKDVYEEFNNDMAAVLKENTELQKKNSQLEVEVNYLKVYLILLAMILLDSHIFPNMETWTAPLIIGILELMAIVLYSRKLGVQDITVWVDKVLDVYKKK